MGLEMGLDMGLDIGPDIGLDIGLDMDHTCNFRIPDVDGVFDD
jgi:hypothetical protein